MCTSEELDHIRVRLESVVRAVRHQCSGADIHVVGSIRHTAGMLMDVLDNDPKGLECDTIKTITKNVEAMVGEFYKKKYSYMFK